MRLYSGILSLYFSKLSGQTVIEDQWDFCVVSLPESVQSIFQLAQSHLHLHTKLFHTTHPIRSNSFRNLIWLPNHISISIWFGRFARIIAHIESCVSIFANKIYGFVRTHSKQFDMNNRQIGRLGHAFLLTRTHIVYFGCNGFSPHYYYIGPGYWFFIYFFSPNHSEIGSIKFLLCAVCWRGGVRMGK